jgi:hypothetical protein
MDKPIEGQVLGPTIHAYNEKNLPSKEWLRRVFEDESLPMSVRIDAAKACAAYEHPRLQQVASDITAGVTIRIEGGLPDLPGTNIIMPGTEKPAANKTNGSGNPES